MAVEHVMDGYEVKVGDTVYDCVFAIGYVERLSPGEESFWVRFSPQNLRCFNTKGFGNFTNRTLFWKDPVVIAPQKIDDTWEKWKHISQAVAEALGRK